MRSGSRGRARFAPVRCGARHRHWKHHGVLGIVHELDLWPALFIGPVTAATTWQKHVNELGRSLYTANNAPKKDWEAIENGDYDAYFITFDRLESFTELLATKNLKVIVADELQKAVDRRIPPLTCPARAGLCGPVSDRLVGHPAGRWTQRPAGSVLVLGSDWSSRRVQPRSPWRTGTPVTRWSR